MQNCSNSFLFFLFFILEFFVKEKVSLHQLTIGQPEPITHIETEEFSHDMQRRLAELGIRIGTTVTVIQKTSGGGRIIKLDHTRYAIDKYTATLIHVGGTH